ncbi:MAG: hypothetical protein WC655_03955 [Candidatus Hydrogenedentales bacterium]
METSSLFSGAQEWLGKAVRPKRSSPRSLVSVVFMRLACPYVQQRLCELRVSDHTIPAQLLQRTAAKGTRQHFDLPTRSLRTLYENK